ncbi:heat shock protein 75 kDa, mitochondrial [Phlebotomus argentipes]|uniref:heat shock protein 75 kDa, mitochondrial n=1 Tax=Phlebotomus argentipes TaxID=94469 RepID=UPI0028933CA1|nr:heat shock protein 75 kDa, mitochondrial [Phlebotomus argentipes]
MTKRHIHGRIIPQHRRDFQRNRIKVEILDSRRERNSRAVHWATLEKFVFAHLSFCFSRTFPSSFPVIMSSTRLLGASRVVRRLFSTSRACNQHVRCLQSRGNRQFTWTRCMSTVKAEESYHSIIRDSEKTTGNVNKHEFQAETRMLLDIVARSLYSEKEVFLRELISNASDALEKFRYTIHTAGEREKDYVETDRSLEIHIGTDKQARTLAIQDTGIGMTKEELVANLGTIARSGSKRFLEEIREKGQNAENSSNIIGQFGVGFYSAFMVADKVEVFTRSSRADSVGLCWSSDGSGTYDIQEAEGVAVGTKIVLHLKPDCREYSDEDRVKEVIKKYSNFVGSSIYLNGRRANNIEPVWLLEPKDVKREQHNDFYRFVGNTFDTPRFILHYKTDVPLSIRALLYFPEGKPGLFDLSRDGDIGVALYTRKILIQSKTENLLPKWLRFVKGVVDSEDIPLNLSRELLQNSSLIRKLRNVLTNRVLRFLQDRAQKEPEEFAKFYRDYGLFLKEGIVTSEEHKDKEEIARLLRFDSSRCTADAERVSLPEYVARKSEEQKDIYYLAAPNRTLAESSPYYEGLKKRTVEVLFCYEPYDELVLMQLGMFMGCSLVSAEKEMRLDKGATAATDLGEGSLLKTHADDLCSWIRQALAGKVANVTLTSRLDAHPCVVTVEEMAAARHFIRTQSHQLSEENRFALLQPQLEINPKHAIVKKLHKLKDSNPELATLLVEQLFANAMVGAGLSEDPRLLLVKMNDLLVKALEPF